MKKSNKSLSSNKKSYKPTEDELRYISQLVENTEGLGYYEAVVADTRLDRHQDILTKSILDGLAKLYSSGRAVVHSHNEKTPCGYTFSASVSPSLSDPEHHELTVRFYVPEESLLLSGMSAKTALDKGLIRRVSVSFSAKNAYKYVAEDSAENIYGHGYWVWSMSNEDMKDPNKFEVYELSLVTMGAQANAVIKDLEKGGIEKEDTLHKNSETVTGETMKYKIASLGSTVDVNEEALTAIKLLEDEARKVSELESKLKVYKDAEDAKKELLVKELVALKVKISKDIDAEKETAKVNKLSIVEIKEEINLVKMIQKNHNPINPNPSEEDKNETSNELPSWAR